MAWTASAMDDDRANAFNADKPLLLSGNAFTASNVAMSSWDGTTWSATNDAATGYPAYNGCDGLAHAYTTATVTGGERYQSLHTVASVSGTIDTIFYIIDPGTTSSAGNVTVTVECADDSAYTTNLTQIVASQVYASGAGVQRLFIDLQPTYISPAHGSSYAGSGYLRFNVIAAGGNTWTQTPRIYEVVLGKRYQLSKKGIRPWDPEPMTNNVVRHVSDSGVISSYVKMAGGWQSSMEWHLDQTGGQYNLDDVDTLRNFWNDSNYGTESFVYVEDPGTAPEYARLCKCSNSVLSMPYNGPNERRFALDMQELPLFATWSP